MCRSDRGLQPAILGSRHGFCRLAAQHGNPRVGRDGLREADVSAARNTGAEVAAGDLLIMLDDDVLADGGVACMRGLLDEHPDWHAVAGNVELFGEGVPTKWRRHPPDPRALPPATLLGSSFTSPGAVLAEHRSHGKHGASCAPPSSRRGARDFHPPVRVRGRRRADITERISRASVSCASAGEMRQPSRHPIGAAQKRPAAASPRHGAHPGTGSA